MNFAKSTPLVLLWLLTLAAAYTIGFKQSPSTTGHSPSTSPSESTETYKTKRADTKTESDAAPARGGSSRLVATLAPTDAVTELARLSDPLERSRGFLALIDRLGPEEFLTVVSEFRELGITEERMAEYRLLLSAWAKADPIAALEYAREHTGGRFARETILSTWSQDDLTSALSWAEQNHEGEGANPWLVGIIRGIADSDPEQASTLTQSLPYSRERGEALQATISALMSKDPTRARQWAESIDDERLRSGAIAQVASQLSRNQPEEAATWLSSVEDVEAQQRAAERVASLYASQDLEKAMTWAESLDANVIDRAAEGVVDRMVEDNPVKAAEWLAKLGQSEVNLDGAIGQLVRGSARSDPYLAATWINGIRDENNRTRYYHRVLGRWMQSDAEAARDFIQNNNVPESVRQRFDQN